MMKSHLEKGFRFVTPEKIVNVMGVFTSVERVRILYELLKEKKRFVDLLHSLRITHSPLRFHLKVLIEKGFVEQEKERGPYFVTPKGKTFLFILEQLVEPAFDGTRDFPQIFLLQSNWFRIRHNHEGMIRKI